MMLFLGCVVDVFQGNTSKLSRVSGKPVVVCEYALGMVGA